MNLSMATVCHILYAPDMPKTAHTLVLPGVIQSRDQAGANCTGELAKWLARSKEERVCASYYDLLLTFFHYPLQRYDFANVRAQFDGLDSQAHWLCADPIHLGVDVAHIYSLGNAYLDFCPDELTEYIDTLNQYLPSGLELVAPHPLRWYLKLEAKWDIECAYPDEILAKTILDKLPRGKDARHAITIFNELQMLLHEHPCNRRRRQQGEPTLDALWLWGAGKSLPRQSGLAWDCVQSNDALALALAKHNHINDTDLTQSVSGNVLFIDTRYLFQDASEARHCVLNKSVHKIYIGNGLAYRKKTVRERLFRSQ